MPAVKQSLSPTMVVGTLIGVLVITSVIAFWLTRSPAGSLEGQTRGAGIPPEIAKEIAERMSAARSPQARPGN